MEVSGSYCPSEPPLVFDSDFVTMTPYGQTFKIVAHKVLNEALIGQTITGHAMLIEGAGKAFHIYAPDDKCPGVRATSETSKEHKCILATNAGYFNMKASTCVGEIISDGRTIYNDPSSRAVFGITDQGKYIAGYVNGTYMKAHKFQQLVQGRGWLVRNGQSYVKTAAVKENITDEFVGRLAPRLSIGWDAQGKLLLVIVDGVEREKKGLDLNTFASLLIKLGARQAVNLDGGGSVTLVWNQHVCESYGVAREACKVPPTLEDAPALRESHERPVTSITCFK